jgi:hypothetical protein
MHSCNIEELVICTQEARIDSQQISNMQQDQAIAALQVGGFNWSIATDVDAEW